MRIPDAAGKGAAKVTLSFPDWKEGKVTPAAVKIPIEESNQTKGN